MSLERPVARHDDAVICPCGATVTLPTDRPPGLRLAVLTCHACQRRLRLDITPRP